MRTSESAEGHYLFRAHACRTPRDAQYGDVWRCKCGIRRQCTGAGINAKDGARFPAKWRVIRWPLRFGVYTPATEEIGQRPEDAAATEPRGASWLRTGEVLEARKRLHVACIYMASANTERVSVDRQALEIVLTAIENAEKRA